MLISSAVSSVDALQKIIDVLATPVFVKDRDHRWVLANDSMCEFMGRSRSELIGKSDFDVVPSEQARIFWRKDDLVFDTGEANENEEQISDRFGKMRTIVTRKRLIHAAGAPLLVAVITDITAFREAEAHSRYLVYHDTLSGLANRALLCEQLDAALAGSAHSDPCNLMLVDLDRFKQVNDVFGHAVGDELIIDFGKRLTSLVRGSDTVARLGGDEFAILLPGGMPAGALDGLCNRILEAARSPFPVAGVSVHVGASIGIVSKGVTDASRSEVLRKADVALYSAKAAGGGCFRVYDEGMDEGRTARLTMETELREAIQTGAGLEIYYQPLFSGMAMAGVEALVRWNHPRLGLLTPSRFMPVAEETGLIIPLGDLIFEKACRALTGWPDISLAVNLSAVQLRDSGLARRILKTIKGHRLDPARLELEITETAVLSADATTHASLQGLRAAGLKIVLDDFGTGYSSLSHLQNLRVDRIKIDQSFVSHLGHASDSAPIVQAVVHLAGMLGLKVTAEGVETEGQRQFLVDTGCSDLQGYLLSPPLPEGQIAPLLVTRSRAPAAEQNAA